MENNDDFMPSEPWDDDNFCTDHIDDGNAYSDIEEPVNLINKPRQVCSLINTFSLEELVYSIVMWCQVLSDFNVTC